MVFHMQERCGCWKRVADWWTETTDAVALSSPYLERGRLRWLLVVFNVFIAMDTGLFMFGRGVYASHRNSFLRTQILIFASFQLCVTVCTLPVLLMAKLARYHTLKVEIASLLAFSFLMRVILRSGRRSYASLIWLCYLLAVMVMKLHPLAVFTGLAVFIPSILESKDMTFDVIHPIVYFMVDFNAKNLITSIFVLGIFATTSCVWYCYAFTCKVRAVRDGNLFSSGDFDPQEHWANLQFGVN